MRGCLCNADPGDYMYCNKAVMDLGKTLQAAIFLLFLFTRLLFEGGIYFLGKSADISDGWIRHVCTIQWRLRLCQWYHRGTASQSVVSCGNNLYNMNSPSASLVIIVSNSFHMCVCAAYTSPSYYLRVVSIQSNMVFFCNGWSLCCCRLKTRVPARHTTKKKEIRGIFVHAEVIPGYDWQQPPGEGMNSRELRFLGETKSQTENLGLRLRALAHLYMEAF